MSRIASQGALTSTRASTSDCRYSRSETIPAFDDDECFTPRMTSGGQASFHFSLLAVDPSSHARRGSMETGRGTVETPAFMPVGTQATVKTLLPSEVTATGAQIVLANTYHLMLRPGLETIVAAGGSASLYGLEGTDLD